MPSNLILRNNKYSVTLLVPEDVRPILKKNRLSKALNTSELKVAEVRKLPYLAEWKQLILDARSQPDKVAQQVYEAGIESRAEAAAGIYASPEDGITHAEAWLDSFIYDLKPSEQKYYSELFAGREGLPLITFQQEWLTEEYGNSPSRTRTEAKLALKVMLPYIPTLAEFSPQNAQRWLNEETRAQKTCSKTASFLSSYFRFLVRMEYIPAGVNPFAAGQLVYPKRLTKKRSWVAYTDDEMQEVMRVLEEHQHEELTLLFDVARYSAMRIAECCRAKKEQREGVSGIVLTEAKTEAGVRWVPIDEDRLALWPDELELNENALGKRFGRVAKEIGTDRHVFHSIRKWCATKLEQAGVSEGIAADFLGHEKQTMSYGLYSAGSSVEQLCLARDALTAANKKLEKLPR